MSQTGCWVRGWRSLSLLKKLGDSQAIFRVLVPEDWLGFFCLNIFACTEKKKHLCYFMTFMLFKLVSRLSPSASIWAIYKSPCKLFYHWTHSCSLLLSLQDKQSPFLILPLPDYFKRSANQSHRFLFALCGSLELQNSIENRYSHFVHEKTDLYEVTWLTQDLSANKERWDLNLELFSSKIFVHSTRVFHLHHEGATISRSFWKR